MSQELAALLTTAALIAFIHTVLGPDHYVPFVAMARARNWSRPKTTLVTIWCGIGHVLSSVVLGMIGIAIGISVTSLESVEAIRGDIAAWALTAFGLAYFVWGLRRAMRHRRKEIIQSHTHDKPGNITPWILFTVFVLGPCEPLIPILMYPAAQHSLSGVVLVVIVFGIITISTMVASVLMLSSGLSLVPFHKLEIYSHALAGFALVLCGVAIQMGL
jgi:nickel/cobalt exporter